jgi:hypothetical protein
MPFSSLDLCCLSVTIRESKVVMINSCMHQICACTDLNPVWRGRVLFCTVCVLNQLEDILDTSKVGATSIRHSDFSEKGNNDKFMWLAKYVWYRSSHFTSRACP